MGWGRPFGLSNPHSPQNPQDDASHQGGQGAPKGRLPTPTLRVATDHASRTTTHPCHSTYQIGCGAMLGKAVVPIARHREGRGLDAMKTVEDMLPSVAEEIDLANLRLFASIRLQDDHITPIPQERAHTVATQRNLGSTAFGEPPFDLLKKEGVWDDYALIHRWWCVQVRPPRRSAGNSNDRL